MFRGSPALAMRRKSPPLNSKLLHTSRSHKDSLQMATAGAGLGSKGGDSQVAPSDTAHDSRVQFMILPPSGTHTSISPAIGHTHHRLLAKSRKPGESAESCVGAPEGLHPLEGAR